MPVLWNARGFAPSRTCDRRQRRRPILRDEARQRLEKRKDFLVAKNLPENDFQKSSKAADFQQENRAPSATVQHLWLSDFHMAPRRLTEETPIK
jgi:hypothetical protein